MRLCLRQHSASETDLKAALSLNRFDADSVEQLGYLMAMGGKPVEALEWIRALHPPQPCVRECLAASAVEMLTTVSGHIGPR